MDRFAAGAVLGRYHLTKPLGRGGMGEVWEAVLVGPRGFRKPVALKVLHTPLQAREQALVAEARLGALIHHPNVVGTYDLGESEGVWFVAMELVRGAPVGELGPLPPRAVLDVGLQACAGLARIHAQPLATSSADPLRTLDLVTPAGKDRARRPDRARGFVHRDVKPSNLLVDTTGTVKVADLGLARLSGRPGARSGTPGFAPPEQLDGTEDARADVFSLAATLFECATGWPLFGTGAEAIVAVRRVEELLADPAFLEPVDRVVAGLGAVLRRALRADPAERLPSARELALALAALVPRQAPGPTLREVLLAARPAFAAEAALSEAGPAPAAGGLPAERDRWFGRPELDAVVRRVGEGSRIVTVTGPGGAGKTRLALAAARELCATGRVRSAWFCDLADARDRDAIGWAVARGLDVRLDPEDPVAQLGRAIAARGRVLLVLDNLEQAAADAAVLVSRWADAAPEALFLCTSRVALRVRGERRMPLGPLPDQDAVALLLDRTPRALGPAEVDEVPALVRDLELHPLAIELASSRLRALRVPELRARLGDRLKLLAGGDADRPERHRSLRASLDASWELLSARGADGLAAMSVFAGGFDLVAADAVVGPDALAVLEELTDASLVQLEPGTGRFGLTEAVRQYALEQLGDDRRGTEDRHGAFFAAMGSAEALRLCDAVADPTAVARVLGDLDNLVAACRRAADRGDGPVAAAALRAAAWAIGRAGPIATVMALADRVLTVPGLAPTDRADALLAHGVASSRAGRPGGLAQIAEAADLLRVAGDGRGEARARIALAGVLHTLDRVDEAEAAVGEALALARALGDREGEALALALAGSVLRSRSRHAESAAHLSAALEIQRADGLRGHLVLTLTNLGVHSMDRGEIARGTTLLEEALALARALGDHRLAGRVLGNLGMGYRLLGRVDDARRSLEEALALHRAAGDLQSQVGALAALGVWQELHGSRAEAERVNREGLAAARRLGDRALVARIAGNLAGVLMELGRPQEAIPLYDEAQALHVERRDRRGEGIVRVQQAVMAVRLGDVPRGMRAFEEGIGLLRTCEDRSTLAQALGVYGEHLARAGEVERADALFDEALAIAATTGAEQVVAVIRSARAAAGR